MTDTATISQNGTGKRKTASLATVGSSGVVQYGGVIYSNDFDKAWRGSQHDRTISQMLNDPLIGSILHAIEMWIRRVDWRVKPADDTNAVALQYAEFVETCLDDMDGTWPGDTMADLLTYLGWGYSVSEIVYKQRVGPYETDPRRRSRYSDNLIGWRGWYLRPQQTRRGWVFENDEAVAFKQIQQNGPDIDIPLDKCIHIRYQSGNGSPEGRSPLRHAYDAWYYKKNIQRIEAIGIERDLAGLPVMRISSRDIEERTDTYTAATAMVTQLRQDSMAGAVISSDRDENGNLEQELILLSTGGTRQFDSDVIIRRYANEVVGSFLAQVMRSGQDGIGARALSVTMSDLFVTSLGAHLDIVQTALNEQAVMPLGMVNGWNLDLMPTVEHGDIESADLDRIGAYMKQLFDSGLLVDSPELRVYAHELGNLPVGDVTQVQGEMDQQRADAQAARDAQMAALQNGQQNQDANQQPPVKPDQQGTKNAQAG